MWTGRLIPLHAFLEDQCDRHIHPSGSRQGVFFKWEQPPGISGFCRSPLIEVYGSLGRDGYFTEETPYSPNSPYSASKAAADHFSRAYHATYGLPVLITNCSNNYGPFQFPEKLIPLMILKALDAQPLPYTATEAT